ncbi:MAG: hypothetical protein ACYDCF_10320, partial [Burkholderiales bacterium]
MIPFVLQQWLLLYPQGMSTIQLLPNQVLITGHHTFDENPFQHIKINILSDLHIEFFAYEPAATDADVVILAGDIDAGLSGIRWAS